MNVPRTGSDGWRSRLDISGFDALKNGNYRLFISGQVVSESGTWLQRLAMSWLVLDLTDSPTALGTVQFFQLGPLFVLSLFTGVLADRLPRRRTLIVLQAVAAVQAATVAALTISQSIQLWHVYALGTVLGIINAFEMPMRQAFLAEMVDREQLQSAVSLNATVKNAARIIGPGIGGMIIATGGLGVCFTLNAVSFLVVLLCLMRMDPGKLLPAMLSARGAMLSQVREGLQYVWRTPMLGFTLLLLACVGMLGYNFNVMIALLARYALDAGALGFGGLNMALGVGAVVGALVMATQPEPTPRSLVVSALIFGVLLLGVGLMPWYVAVLGFLVALGVLSTTFQAGTNVLLQLHADEGYRGRVVSLFVLLTVGVAPVGGWLTGYLTELWGIRGSVSVLAMSVLVVGLVGSVYVTRRLPGAPSFETQRTQPSLR